jgi:hypothetical protein
VDSGALLDRRVASGPTREASLGPSGRPAAGFRRFRGRVQVSQKCRKGAVNPNRRQPSGVVAPLPGQSAVGDMRPRQSELGERGQNQPRPPVGLFGVAHAEGVPSERLLEEAEGMLQIEAPDVGAPEEAEIRRGSFGADPPQPQSLRLAPPLASGQPFDLHHNEGSDHYGRRAAAASSFVRLNLRMHPRPGPHAHSPVTGVLAFVLGGGLGPGARLGAFHLRAVAAWPTGGGGHSGEAWVGVKTAPGAQANEDLARKSLQSLLELDGIVAGVEYEQRHTTASHRGASEQTLDLLAGYLVRLLLWSDAANIHGRRPTLAYEAQLRDELVGPSGDDGLPGGVARRMIVVSALGTGLRIAAGPHAPVHGIDGRVRSFERVADEQVPQSLGVDPSAIQRGVEATPAATVRCLKTQMNWGRDGVGGEEGVGDLEEGVGSAVEAIVERAAEAAKSVVGIHDAFIMHSSRDRRLPFPQMELKRKLRVKKRQGTSYPSRVRRRR